MNKKIILASNSPRRKELMNNLGIPFEVRIIPGIDESYPENLSAHEVPLYIARQKSRAYTIAPDELLITADTVVILDNEVMGKPETEEQAMQMLSRLSGKTHDVVTGCVVRTTEEIRTFSVTTQVTFAQLRTEDIQRYVQSGQAMDKAGAYGIQEWIGLVGVTGINGSYFNVMGLPVQRLYEVVRVLG